jgi:hypothetical protein
LFYFIFIQIFGIFLAFNGQKNIFWARISQFHIMKLDRKFIKEQFPYVKWAQLSISITTNQKAGRKIFKEILCQKIILFVSSDFRFIATSRNCLNRVHPKCSVLHNTVVWLSISVENQKIFLNKFKIFMKKSRFLGKNC